MNKSRFMALASAIALVSMSSAPAMASSFPSVGPVTGTITFSQSLTITCDFAATATVVGSDVHLTGMAFIPGSGHCGTTVNPGAGPWILVGAASHPSTPVLLTGVSASTVIGGNCAGDIWVDVTDDGSGGHYIDILNQVVPGTPINCTIVEAALQAS